MTKQEETKDCAPTGILDQHSRHAWRRWEPCSLRAQVRSAVRCTSADTLATQKGLLRHLHVHQRRGQRAQALTFPAALRRWGAWGAPWHPCHAYSPRRDTGHIAGILQLLCR